MLGRRYRAVNVRDARRERAPRLPAPRGLWYGADVYSPRALLVLAFSGVACSSDPVARDAATPDAPADIARADAVSDVTVEDRPSDAPRDTPPVDVARDVTSELVDAAPPCTDACGAGTTRCTAGTLETCARVGACTRWGDATRCASGGCAGAVCMPPPALAMVTFASDVSYPAGDGTNWVGLGDFNADRHLDVAAVNTDTSSVSLLLGNGDGTLRAATTVPLMHTRFNGALVHAAIGDFEGDGRADLAVSWRNVNEITVFRGASFSTPTRLSVVGPEGIAIADLNGDGRGDLAYVSRGSTGATVETARFNADNTFATPTRTTVSTPYRVLPRDLDGDGAVDLTILGSSILVWRNAGDGTFTERWRGAGSGGADGVAVADFTGDGALDLITTFSGTNGKSLRRGMRDGTYEAMSSSLYLGDDRHIATGDFNRDGRADLVLSACCNSVSVALGRGDATFMSQSVHIGCGVVGGFAVGDLNEDGLADIVIAHGNCDSVSVLLNRSR